MMLKMGGQNLTEDFGSIGVVKNPMLLFGRLFKLTYWKEKQYACRLIHANN